jgi:hypothetical protein
MINNLGSEKWWLILYKLLHKKEIVIQSFNILSCMNSCKYIKQYLKSWEFILKIIVKFTQFSSLMRRPCHKDCKKNWVSFLKFSMNFESLDEFLEYINE